MGIGVVLARTWNPADHGIEMIGSVPRGLPRSRSRHWASDIEPPLGGLAVAVAAVGEGLPRPNLREQGATTASIPTRSSSAREWATSARLTGGMGVRQPEPNRHGSHQRGSNAGEVR